MFKHTPEQQATIDALDVTYRCHRRNDPANAARSGTVCEIIDKTTGKAFAEAMGMTEPDALTNALKAAQRAPRPLTRAQASEPEELQRMLQETRERYYAQQGDAAPAPAVPSTTTDPDPEPSPKAWKKHREWKARRQAAAAGVTSNGN